MSIDLAKTNTGYKNYLSNGDKFKFSCDYLIITSKLMKPSLNEFVSFKRNIINHKTELICIEDIKEITKEIVNSSEALLKFMKFVHFWKKFPKYVLLVGDYKILPGYPVEASGHNVNSDQRYSAVNDNDYHSWCNIGRICSNNTDEIKNICRHIIRYNHLSITNDWHKRVIMTGWTPGSPHRYYFNDDGSKETRPNQEYPDFGELDEKEARGLNCAIPRQGSGIPASWHYTNQTDAYEVLRSYEWKECSVYFDENDKPLLASQHTDCSIHDRIYDPNQLLEIDYWGVRNASKSALIHAINNGALIVKYLGHSAWDHWANVGHLHCQKPSDWDLCNPLSDFLGGAVHERCLTRWEVKEKIMSQNNPPLVLSLSCLAGMIEDPRLDTPEDEVTFAEMWQRSCNAIGVYAASIVSPSYYNARIGRYFFRALTRGFNGSGPIKTVGIALNVANNELLKAHSDEAGECRIGDDIENGKIQLIKDAIRMFRYFGDPETRLRY